MMKVAACQLPEVLGDIERATSLMRDYAEEAERQGADLVCFPECFLQGCDIRSGHIASMAVERGSSTLNNALEIFDSITPVIVFGLIEKDADIAYNAAPTIKDGDRSLQKVASP